MVSTSQRWTTWSLAAGIALAMLAAHGTGRAAPPAVAASKEPSGAKQAPVTYGPGELAGIVFENRTYFRDVTLRTFVRHPVGFALDDVLMADDVETIQAKYRSRGFVHAKISWRKEALPNGAVQVVVHIEAGERAPLREVLINGNRAVSDAVLSEGLFSRAAAPLGALTQAGLYHKPYLSQDGQRLVTQYYKRGHLEARVQNTRVSALPALDGLSLSFDVVEGPVYELAGLELRGDLPKGATAEGLRAQIPVADGGVADLITIHHTLDTLLNALRDEGYPEVRFRQSVVPAAAPSGDKARRGVKVVFEIARGSKAKIGKLVLSGNAWTKPNVITRAIALKTGDDYSLSALNRAKAAIQGLGYFDRVEVKHLPSTEPGVVDIAIKVHEMQTWTASVMPAVLGNEGFVLIGLAAERNLFGTGMFASVTGQVSGLRQLFDMTVVDPRFLDTTASLSGELHRRELGYTGFRLRTTGGSVAGTVPLVSRLFVSWAAGAEYAEIPEGNAGEAAALGTLPGFRNTVQLGMRWDGRDSRIAPRNGAYAELTARHAGIATLSAVDATVFSGDVRFFYTPFWGITFKTHTRAGRALTLGDGRTPVTDRFFLGGYGSVRGYLPRSLTPVENGVGVGGTAFLSQNVELEFPVVPGGLFRGFIFADAGQTLTNAELAAGGPGPRGVDLPLGLYWSTGGGVVMNTPALPLRLEWSVPLTPRPSDRPYDFFLGFGSAF